MNKLDLNAYGVQEMNAKEAQKTNGGWLFGFGPLNIGVHLTRVGLSTHGNIMGTPDWGEGAWV